MHNRTIRVIEHPGYFETIGDIYDINPGTYQFEVENKSNKDAGFVLMREGEKPITRMIKTGEKVSVQVELKSGDYTYYCPLIPTPSYPLRVK
ncbi:hypothetical protein LLG96_04020 [bacterium]|nr:hypothetical protein [bacterium]